MERIKSTFTSQIAPNSKMIRNFPSKQQVNNTPIRIRETSNKQNITNGQNRSKDIRKNQETNDFKNQGYDRELENSKTLIKRKVSSSGINCVNHSQDQAQFRILIEDQNLSYCGKCATHLASNGFQVQKIRTSRTPKALKDARSPYTKKRQQLMNFITSLKKIQQGFIEKEQDIQKIHKSYQIEKQKITNFYIQILEYIEQVRDQHMQFLDEEAERNTQICQIEVSEISQTLQQIADMKEDIENNIHKIVQQVQQSSYAQCMNYYHQKEGVHSHRLQELGVDAKPALCTTAECIQQKLNEFKDFVDDICGILSSKAEPNDY